MKHKETLRLPLSNQEDDEIIIVRPTASSYVDEDYFRKIVGEVDSTDQQSRTFAVKIECVRADWIINVYH